MESDNSSKKDHESRRDILRYLGIGAISTCFGWLFYRAWENGQCIGHSQCRKCMANSQCELPLAIEYRGGKKHNHHDHDHHNQQQFDDQEQNIDSEQSNNIDKKSANRKLENG